MGRWEADAPGRLRAAALELYVERGFEQTTVADIAGRAGLTARTFFRHFADKREVLFSGTNALRDRIVDALEAAPADVPTMVAVGAAVQAGAEYLGQHREQSRRRQSIIMAHAELRERGLIKMAFLSAALADGLRKRGVPDPDAALAAETGMVAVRVAFEQWVGARSGPGLPELTRDALGRLTAIVAAVSH
ncbi:TetR family transcriptional regulator [Virgisporangium aliadipatigenens]|uniref:TetR family transcriptional regulator n=1 Tax=Virgisporangium aliadipatigenens TaxID=741659 RepID=UPI001942A249|nr:TetR family transcriptional regulator [Virgisporangium aliadipatigenens]